MKINQKREGLAILYYLSSRRHFKTIVELVSFYERNDLGENFAGYDAFIYKIYIHIFQFFLSV